MVLSLDEFHGIKIFGQCCVCMTELEPLWIIHGIQQVGPLNSKAPSLIVNELSYLHVNCIWFCFKSVLSTCSQDKDKQINSVALSPRANYTDWATATWRQNLVPTFVDRGVSRDQRDGSPMAVNLTGQQCEHQYLIEVFEIWHWFSVVNLLQTLIDHGPPVWSNGQSSWAHIQVFRVHFLVLPNFLNSSGSGMELTQPCEEVNKKVVTAV
jgi:hypothetical protein